MTEKRPEGAEGGSDTPGPRCPHCQQTQAPETRPFFCRDDGGILWECDHCHGVFIRWRQPGPYRRESVLPAEPTPALERIDLGAGAYLAARLDRIEARLSAPTAAAGPDCPRCGEDAWREWHRLQSEVADLRERLQEAEQRAAETTTSLITADRKIERLKADRGTLHERAVEAERAFRVLEEQIRQVREERDRLRAATMPPRPQQSSATGSEPASGSSDTPGPDAGSLAAAVGAWVAARREREALTAQPERKNRDLGAAVVREVEALEGVVQAWEGREP